MGIVRWTIRLGIFGVVLFALTCLVVLYENERTLKVYGADRPDDRPVKVAIVLGGGINPDGTANIASRQRTERAMTLLENRGAETIIFSGGAGKYCPKRSTAASMRDYALSAGISAEQIVIEDESRTTFQNLRNSLAIAEDLGAAPDGSDIAIVTDSTHLTRSWLLSSYFGATNPQLAASDSMTVYDTYSRLYVVSREAAAIWYNFGKVVAWEAMGLIGIPIEKRAEIIR